MATGRRTRATGSIGVWCIAALMSMGVAGCAKPIFAPHQSRTQYDRYDRLRNQYAPQFVQDDLGRRTPNIRERLTPKP